MSAWLLWLRRHPGPLWCRYLSLLPREEDMSCLLNFQTEAEQAELQLPELRREAEVQARWWVAVTTRLCFAVFVRLCGLLSPVVVQEREACPACKTKQWPVN
jgi:hypothetical protein